MSCRITTCGSCCTDPTEGIRFIFNGQSMKQDCHWAHKKKTDTRCVIAHVATTFLATHRACWTALNTSRAMNWTDVEYLYFHLDLASHLIIGRKKDCKDHGIPSTYEQ